MVSPAEPFICVASPLRLKPPPRSLAPANARAQAAKMRMYMKAIDFGPAEGTTRNVPAVSMMAIIGYTHTQAPLPPPTDPQTMRSAKGAGDRS